jgi:type VI secretion system secreted protein Hcp
MAVDYFLLISGVEGESTDAKHKGWIDVESWSWGETQSGPAGSGGGGGAGKVTFQDFHFVSKVSKASPALFLACASGQHIKEAKLAGRKAGKGQQEFLTWTFSNVIVSSYQTGGAEGADATFDQISLKASKAQITYSAVTPPITAGWDSKTNTKV